MAPARSASIYSSRGADARCWYLPFAWSITGVVEYVIGLAALEIFGLRLWDYRGLFLSIGGLACLRSVVSFGILGLVFLYLVEPMLAWILKRLPVRALYVLCGALAAVFLTDCAFSALFRTPITH